MKLTTAQIGRAGEFFTQYRLLLCGIDSAPMTTDAGIDLVAYASGSRDAVTIQVKTNLKAKPGGGKGKTALDWWVPVDTPAELIALVDLSSQRLWMFRGEEMANLAQQTASGRHHLYMYTDPTARVRKSERLAHAYEFERFLLENRVHELFPR